MKMDNDSESEKPGVIIFGQLFCSKLEHIPIKKRILLRDSALYQRTPSSIEDQDQNIDSPPVSQKFNLPVSPFVAQHSDSNFFFKQQSDSLKPLQLNDNNNTVVLNNEEADSHPLLSGIQTLNDFIGDKAVVNSRIEALSSPTISELPSVSSFATVAKDDGLGTIGSESVPSLTGNVTKDSYSYGKSTFQPGHGSRHDLEAVQSITQDNRILWDLNVEMDAWEKPDNCLKVESSSHPDMQSVTNQVRSEDFRLKGEMVMLKTDTKSNRQPTVEYINSGGICKHEHIITYPTDVEPCKSDRNDRGVAGGSCPDYACSIAEPSIEIVSINISCSDEVHSKIDEHAPSILGENTIKIFASAPKEDPVSLCATPYNSVISTEEQGCDNKNIIIESEGLVNVILVNEDEDNSSSKKDTNSKAGELDINYVSSLADQREQRVPVSVGEGGLSATSKQEVSVKAAPSTLQSKEQIEKTHEHVDILTGNPLLGSFQEGCNETIVQPLSAPVMCNQGATLIKQGHSMDRDNWVQIEQDYEDGELRDLDMHCWDEDEIKIGELECLDYEPSIENIDDLDESHSSVSAVGKGENGLKSEICKLSDTLVKDHLVRMNDRDMGLNKAGKGTCVVTTHSEKKLSGWDQLPKDGYASSEKVHETQRIISRTSRSELQSCSDMPTLSGDTEDKETVLERRIRPRDMDDSYLGEGGSSFDKFGGKRRPTTHMQERYRAEDWDSEHRSSVNYHDLYDNHSVSRHMNVTSRGREPCRSRSPYDRDEAYGPHISYSRYSRGRHGSRAEGPGRSLRGGRNGYRGSLTGDRTDEFCVRPQLLKRDRSFSPRPTAHFSDTFNRSRSRSITRSPPLWVRPYERLGPRVHRRSPEFHADDRVKKTRLTFWKSDIIPDNEMRYTSPSQSGYRAHNKSRWNDEEDFDLRVSRDRSPIRSFRQKEKFDASCSRRSFKSSEDLRPVGYRGRIREFTPDRDRDYIGGKDRRKHEDSFEAEQRKRYYKDGFTHRSDTEYDIATQNFISKDNFLEDGETRSVNKRKK